MCTDLKVTLLGITGFNVQFHFLQALVDGPETGVPRGQMRLNQLHLTKFKINFQFTGPTKAVRQSWIKNKINDQWAAGMWAQKIAAKRKVCRICVMRI